MSGINKMAYNLSQVVNENTTTVFSVFQGANDVLMNGWLFTLLLMALAVIFFTSFLYRTQNVKNSMIGTSFVVTVLAFILFGLGVIPDIVFYISLISCALTLGASFLSSS